MPISAACTTRRPGRCCSGPEPPSRDGQRGRGARTFVGSMPFGIGSEASDCDTESTRLMTAAMRGAVDLLRQRLDRRRELRDRHLALAVADVDHRHRHARRDALHLRALVVDEPREAAARAFADDDHAAAADGAVDGFLRLRVDADGHLARLPVAAERRREDVTGGARHPVDLACTSRASTAASSS